MPHAAWCSTRRYLQLPLRRDDAPLQAMLQRALPLTVLQYRRDRLLVQRVRPCTPTRRAADAVASGGAERVGAHAAPPAARRGLLIQQLKDDKPTRATELLERSRRPIKQIAAAVGFHNEKSFAQAFAGWTGWRRVRGGEGCGSWR